MNKSMVGELLIASTLVDDPVFSRAVCLIVHEDEDGVIGVLLNRPIHPAPAGIQPMLAETQTGGEPAGNRLPQLRENKPNPSSADQVLAAASQSIGTVHFGGPNSGPVVAVHTSSQLAEAETGVGIYVAAQKQHLETLVQEKNSPYRLIIGHVGWSHEQLHDEIEMGLWHHMPATSDAVFSDDQEMWPIAVRRATARSVAGWIGVPDVPIAYAIN